MLPLPKHAARFVPALLGLACSACDTSSVSGGLVVRVESDLALPKDLDLLRLEARLRGDELLAVERDLFGAESRALEFSIAPVSDAAAVEIHAVGYKAGQARVERRSITTIPSTRTALLRMPLNYLCSGMLGDAGCPARQTCQQGECRDARVPAASLPDYDPPPSASEADAGQGEGAGDCFDPARCFAGSQAAQLDAANCSFDVSGVSESGALNVAVRLPPGASGQCDASACFIVLEAGGSGWFTADDRVALPAGVCAREPLPDIVFSTRCATKTEAGALCGSSASPQLTAAPPPRARAPMLPPAIGSACEPPDREACGRCGTRTRTCRDGKWSEWSECRDEGECLAQEQRACGRGGTRVCSAACRWGDCQGQSCEGPDTQVCGVCGTQHRTCDNGRWSDWSPCANEGVCKPGAVEACGSQGSRACGGKCQWGECGDQSCPGAPTQPCPRCGTGRRSCDPATGQWSDWGACEDQGACSPNETRPCGTHGMNTCLGNCEWDPVCRNQICEGPPSTPCGNCGTAAHTCDPTTGSWSEGGTCTGQGECTPEATRSCGSSGEQRCGTDCRWSDSCSGQTCTGSDTQGCGSRCGTQTRSCDPNTGRWSEWGSCSGEGPCEPGSSERCEGGGRRSCGADCRWQACRLLSCDEALTQSCGRCGTQTRTCDSSTGQVSAWGACSGEGACEPGSIQDCGSGGRRTCTSRCQWPSECPGQKCDVPPTRPCGNCGVQSSTCNTDTGMATWSTCSGEGVCATGETQDCGVGGKRTCGSDCRWPSNCPNQTCNVPASRVCGNCGTQRSSCDSNTGVATWSDCTGEGECQPDGMRSCGGTGQQICGKTCGWGSCDCGAATLCSGTCVDTASDESNCGRCGGLCPAGQECRAGQCAPIPPICESPQMSCPGAGCVDPSKDPKHCGSCGIACPEGTRCVAGACVCPAVPRVCDSTCVADDNPKLCGMGCSICPGPTSGNGKPVCVENRCSIDCADGYTRCGDECVDTQSNNRHCGGCNLPCAVAGCIQGSCGGAMPVGGAGGTGTAGAAGSAGL